MKLPIYEMYIMKLKFGIFDVGLITPWEGEQVTWKNMCQCAGTHTCKYRHINMVSFLSESDRNPCLMCCVYIVQVFLEEKGYGCFHFACLPCGKVTHTPKEESKMIFCLFLFQEGTHFMPRRHWVFIVESDTSSFK
jgi:hypothetical protein